MLALLTVSEVEEKIVQFERQQQAARAAALAVARGDSQDDTFDDYDNYGSFKGSEPEG